MKLKLKTATLIALVASALCTLLWIVNTILYIDLKFYDFGSSIETLIQLFFPIGLTIFLYVLYKNQK